VSLRDRPFIFVPLFLEFYLVVHLIFLQAHRSTFEKVTSGHRGQQEVRKNINIFSISKIVFDLSFLVVKKLMRNFDH